MSFGKGALLWLLGIPLPIILLLALFWRWRGQRPDACRTCRQTDGSGGFADTPDAGWRRDWSALTGVACPDQTMFFFFSNRIGCIGSLVVSAVVTLAILMLLGIL
jgi:hypothetical protein